MAFQEFFNRRAEKAAFQQKMKDFRETRDDFLATLIAWGVESTHGWDEVIFGGEKGRRMTTVKLVAAGGWEEGNGIQVEIAASVLKNKLVQAKKKPTVYVKLTFDDRVVRSSIPNNVTNASTYTEDKFGNKEAKNVTFSYESMAEVMEYFQVGKLAVVRE